VIRATCSGERGHIPPTMARVYLRHVRTEPLRKAQPGDIITLRTRERVFQYEAEWTMVVPPTASQLIQPTPEPILTLVTCFPFYYVGAAPERLIVRARRISAAPSGAP
jgi:sortase A